MTNIYQEGNTTVRNDTHHEMHAYFSQTQSIAWAPPFHTYLLGDINSSEPSSWICWLTETEGAEQNINDIPTWQSDSNWRQGIISSGSLVFINFK